MNRRLAHLLAIGGVGFVVLGSWGGAVAQSAAQAHTFVLGLYAAYHGDGPDNLGRGTSRVFSPRMLALIRRDRALTPKGDVGALDGDPICNCQDFEISKVEAKVTTTAPGRAQAIASFVNLGTAVTVRLDLVSVAGQWRIDNIHTADMPDLAAFLQAHAGGR